MPRAASAGFRFLDYACFNLRGIGVALPVNRASGKQPPIQYYKKFSQSRDGSAAELACDEIISSTTAGTDFAQPNPTSSFNESSSHTAGRKPMGMNALSFDGHVAWRPWSQSAATPVQQANGAYFWIVDP